MSSYIKSPFKPAPALIISGTPLYLFGSFNDRTSPTKGIVLSNSVDSFNNATVTFQVQDGNIPVVGALITIVGSANSAGAFNVTNRVIASVSSVLLTGLVTVIFSLAASAQPNAADVGQVLIPQPEIGEALPVEVNFASVPGALVSQGARLEQGRAVTAIVSFPVLPTAVTVKLQQAMKDIDSEYADLATVTSVVAGVQTGGQITLQGVLGLFLRFNTSGVVGGNSSLIVAKLIA